MTCCAAKNCVALCLNGVPMLFRCLRKYECLGVVLKDELVDVVEGDEEETVILFFVISKIVGLAVEEDSVAGTGLSEEIVDGTVDECTLGEFEDGVDC